MPTVDLAIDYGTSNTVALVRGSDGRTRQLLFDGSPLLPSAVLAASDGTIRAGRDAVRAARLDPGRYEPNPKRRIDESEVLLGEQVYPIGSLIAATLSMVRGEAQRLTGGVPGRVLLTHPVAWGSTRRAVLSDACVRAGLPAPTLIPEPVAAATYFAALPYVRIGAGQAVVVYDLGAGTFDVSVVRKGQQGFETLGYNGLDDVGGLDLDAVVVQHALAPLARANPPAWQRLTRPHSTEDRRSHRMLWDDARDAKETLSRQQKATFPLPLTEGDAMITRAEFERSAQPLLLRTVEVTTEAIRQSRVPADQLAGVFLVGGGSRIPLVATLLHQRQGVAPTALEQPEIVVAEGALAAVHGGGVRQGAAVYSGSPSGAPPVPPVGIGAPPVPPVGVGAQPVSGLPVPPVGIGAGPAGRVPADSNRGGRPANASADRPAGASADRPAGASADRPAGASADRPQSGAGAGAAGLLWPGSNYTPPPTPPLSGPSAPNPAPSGGSADPFGPPPALSDAAPPPVVWPQAAPLDTPTSSPPGPSGSPGSPAGRPGARPQIPNQPSTRLPSRPGPPNQGGNWPPAPDLGGPSWPSTGPVSGPHEQGVSAPNRSGGGARPAPAATGRAYGRPARARQVFAATDLLWVVPTLLWVPVAAGDLWEPATATVFAIASMSLALLGYPLDTRFGRRLPWWGKLAIPAVGGVVLGYGLAASSLPVVFAVLTLLACAGVAWLLLRRR